MRRRSPSTLNWRRHRPDFISLFAHHISKHPSPRCSAYHQHQGTKKLSTEHTAGHTISRSPAVLSSRSSSAKSTAPAPSTAGPLLNCIPEITRSSQRRMHSLKLVKDGVGVAVSRHRNGPHGIPSCVEAIRGWSIVAREDRDGCARLPPLAVQKAWSAYEARRRICARRNCLASPGAGYRHPQQ